jgi:transposase
LAALHTTWASGNANKLTPEQRHELGAKLAHYTPEQVIAPDLREERGAFWTVSDVQIVVMQWYGVMYRSPTSYRRLLDACGLSYQKVEKVYRSQPGAVQLADFEADLEKK